MNIRLDSYLSKNGVTSRRKAKELIETGKITVNNKAVNEVIVIDTDKDEVKAFGKTVKETSKYIYIMLNKPLNVLSTTHDDRGRRTVLDVVKTKERIFPVGRLDYNSTGLILLTDDGELALKLTHPRYEIEKTYTVCVNEVLDENSLNKMRKGVEIYGQITLPAEINKLNSHSFEITLKQGLKRQIREMCKAVGLSVASLERIKMGNLELGDLAEGEYRELTSEELNLLKKLTE